MKPSKLTFIIEIAGAKKTIVNVSVKRKIDGIMPSIDGEVLFILFNDTSNSFYETRTGKRLSKPQVERLNAQFYQ
jgi:hypothetical protein